MPQTISHDEWKKLAQITSSLEASQRLLDNKPEYNSLRRRIEIASSMVFAIPISRNSVKVFLKTDRDEIIEYLRDNGCTDSEYLSAEYWDQLASIPCRLQYLPKVSVSVPKSFKRKSGHRIKITVYPKCFGECDGHTESCQSRYIEHFGGRIMVCQCC